MSDSNIPMIIFAPPNVVAYMPPQLDNQITDVLESLALSKYARNRLETCAEYVITYLNNGDISKFYKNSGHVKIINKYDSTTYVSIKQIYDYLKYQVIYTMILNKKETPEKIYNVLYNIHTFNQQKKFVYINQHFWNVDGIEMRYMGE